MATELIKDVGNRKIKRAMKKKKKTKNNLNDSSDKDLFPLQVVKNKTEFENIMKDYVVQEDEQQVSKNKISQRKIRKMEKVKSRKEKSLETKSLDTEERTIFVGNVNVKSSRGDVKQFFTKYGEIETIRFRGITPESEEISKKEAVAKKLFHPNRKSLNAYVRFKEQSSVDKALEANGEIFNEFHIQVDRAIKSTNYKDKNSVFIGNLPFEVNEEDIWKHFESCGKITNVRVVRSSTTGAGKGFGFAHFESADGVELALHLNGHKLMDRELRVKKCVKKEKVKGKEQIKKSESKFGKKKAGANFSSKTKRKSKPMDISFLKNDKPGLLNKMKNERGVKRKRHDKSDKGKSTKSQDFKGVKAVHDGKVIKKRKKRLNAAEKRKLVLAKKLSQNL